jgi:L-ascorbate metabolism protein UlaG (beta-lactamase superfamily)
MSIFPVFGKSPAGTRLQRIQGSSHYSNGSFQNLVPTEVIRKDANFFKMLRDYRNRPADTAPSQPIPSIKTNLKTLPDNQASIVWFGHSSYLLKLGKTHILVDPVFSGNASPVSFLAKAFPGANSYGAGDMPETLEALLLTHDHYDHLDYKTILQLKDRTNHFYTSLGVGAHLESWGIPPEKITELDWWETCKTDTFTLTATPARHFSGRGFKRGAAAWSSFVLKTPQYNLFLGGDSGYEQHFKTIGEKYGPFDLALLECGQYGVNWPYIHMQPEETVRAAFDLKATTLFPVHWAKFTLALHPWNEPIRRVTAAAAGANLRITTPRIGEPVIINQHYPIDAWYDFL